MHKRSRAILIEKTKVDTSQAQLFGDVVHVFPPGKERSSIWSDEFLDEALNSLADMEYDPVSDYIILVGQLVPLTKVIARLVSIYNNIRVLCWSATERDYVLQEFGYGRENEERLQSNARSAR